MRTPASSHGGSTLGERYRVLLDIGRNLAGTLSVEQLFRVLHRETARVLEAPGFYISLYDEAHDVATVVFYADRDVESRVEITYPGSESEVIAQGRPSIIEDRSSLPSLLVLGEEEEGPTTRSAISAPLRHKGRILGAISAQSYRPDAYAAEELELLQGIADIAAVAIENAQHVAELHRQRQEADQIEEIGRALTRSLDVEEVLEKVVEAVLALIEVESATVWLLDGTVACVAASGGTIALRLGLRWDLRGPLYDRLAARDPIFLEDIHNNPWVPEEVKRHLGSSSGLTVPLLVEDQVRGAVSIGRLEGAEFSEEDRRVLKRLSNQAAIALENAGLHESVQALSLTDPLTGLPNRRHLEIHLEREVAAAQRGRDLVVVVFDLDNFKRYNDTHGHLAGDEVLRAFGRILVTENRAMNLGARLGGDEFVSVLSDTNPVGARAYLSRIRDGVSSDRLLSAGGITVSFGMAVFDPASMSTAQDILLAADARLYDNKAEKGSPER